MIHFIQVRLRARRINSIRRTRLSRECYQGFEHLISTGCLTEEDAEQIADIAAQLSIDYRRDKAEDAKILRELRRFLPDRPDLIDRHIKQREKTRMKRILGLESPFVDTGVDE